MSKIWIISDTHFGHNNIVKYRPEFATVEEHNETIYNNIVSTVGKNDVLIFCGDIAFNEEWLEKIDQIVCIKKILILGNHDTERVHIEKLVKVYDHIHSLWSYKGVLISHAPIHQDELRSKLNVHGHCHSHLVADNRYINVCVEHTEWKPVDFLKLIAERRQLITDLDKVLNPIVE